MRSSRAIIFFVRSESDERRHKPLPRIHGQRPEYRAVNRALLSRLRPALRNADLVIASTGKVASIEGEEQILQRGSTFGERICSAAADTFALGYREVIIVGNDCPDIEATDITAAFALLQKGSDVVAAPARDGGAFLIGLTAGGFSPDWFRSLPWQTSDLFDLLTALPEAEALPICRDDFDSWRGYDATIALAQLLNLSDRGIESIDSIPFHFSFRQRKAITRSWLPAPPSFH